MSIKYSIMKKVELLFVLILLSSTLIASSNVGNKNNRLCEKLKLAPVLIEFDNQSVSQVHIYNTDHNEEEEDHLDNSTHNKDEILIDFDSFNSFSSASKKNSCTCLNPCRIRCCQNKQNFQNTKTTYNYLSRAEYVANNYASDGRPVCVKNYINQGYFSPSSFHPSESSHSDLFHTKYLGDMTVFSHQQVIFSTKLTEFCKNSLPEEDDYYLLNNKTLIKKSKTDSFLEIIATRDYCVEPLRRNVTIFTICDNNYGLDFYQELTSSTTTSEPFRVQTDVTERSFRKPKSNFYESTTLKNLASQKSSATQVHAALLSNYTKFSWLTSIYLIILLTAYLNNDQLY